MNFVVRDGSANIDFFKKNIGENKKKLLGVIAKVKIGVKKSSQKTAIYFVKGTFLANIPNGKIGGLKFEEEKRDFLQFFPISY